MPSVLQERMLPLRGVRKEEKGAKERAKTKEKARAKVKAKATIGRNRHPPHPRKCGVRRSCKVHVPESAPPRVEIAGSRTCLQLL